MIYFAKAVAILIFTAIIGIAGFMLYLGYTQANPFQ